MQFFEYAVVGRGLIGSAAAKYFSVGSKNVAVIGPDEPIDWKLHSGVFASHYDQGRITRVLDTDELWAKLAQRSIERYTSIEQKSGIKFFHPVGCLKATPATATGLAYLEQNKSVSRTLNSDFATLNHQELEEQFPYLRFPHRYEGLLETFTGYINPRSLVQAQLLIAEARGAVQIRETVTRLEPAENGVHIITAEGSRYNAGRVLVAAGSFANCIDVPCHREFNTTLRGETVLLAKVDNTILEQLHLMPSLIYCLDDNPHFSYLYILPPIQYPDGNYYVKAGGDNEAPISNDMKEIERWFHTDGDAQVGTRLRDTLITVIPALSSAECHTKPCIFADSTNQRPFIDEWIAGRVYVATGCCGASAKSSDELGRLACQLVAHGTVDEDYNSESFKAIFVESIA